MCTFRLRFRTSARSQTIGRSRMRKRTRARSHIDDFEIDDSRKDAAGQHSLQRRRRGGRARQTGSKRPHLCVFPWSTESATGLLNFRSMRKYTDEAHAKTIIILFPCVCRLRACRVQPGPLYLFTYSYWYRFPSVTHLRDPREALTALCEKQLRHGVAASVG